MIDLPAGHLCIRLIDDSDRTVHETTRPAAEVRDTWVVQWNGKTYRLHGPLLEGGTDYGRVFRKSGSLSL